MARRRSFDPSQVKVTASERSAQPGSDTISPSGVNTLVRDALSARLPRTLRVIGEIGEWTRAGSGHLYFSLSDAESELRCVMWRSDAAKLKFEPESGLEVIATGGIDVYLPRGTYQLMVRKLEPRGIGALEIAFRQLKDKLEAEGLFDRARKRKLPFVPQRAGVVTSPSGAAIRDITHTLARRFPGLEILIFPCRVQGEGAAQEIATAIQQMNSAAERLGGIDVAIVGRGGGSLEDLWAFNEEPVARAIYTSRIPIVSAVGHEIDTSISDLVADVRAATPTAAAELIAPQRSELLEAVNLMMARAGNNLKHRFALAQSEYARLAASDLISRPQRGIQQFGQQLDELLSELKAVTLQRLADARRTTNELEIRLLRQGSQVRFGDVRNRVEQRIRRVTQAAQGLAHDQDRRLQQRLWRLDRKSPERLLSVRLQSVDSAISRVAQALRNKLHYDQQRLQASEAVLHAVDPKQILKRGFAIVRLGKDKSVLRSVDQVRDGQRLSVTLSDGQFHATAEDPRQPTLFDELDSGD